MIHNETYKFEINNFMFILAIHNKTEQPETIDKATISAYGESTDILFPKGFIAPSDPIVEKLFTLTICKIKEATQDIYHLTQDEYDLFFNMLSKGISPSFGVARY